MGPDCSWRRISDPYRQGPCPVASDCAGVLGVCRSGNPVRQHHQPLEHRREHRPASTPAIPCSEYLHLDDSACNLASLNLLGFHSGDGVDGFDIEGFRPCGADRPSQPRRSSSATPTTPPRGSATTPGTSANSGLGYANLGALLMTLGMPYDSAQGASRRRLGHSTDDRRGVYAVDEACGPHGALQRFRREPRAHAAGSRPAPLGGCRRG